MPEQGQSWCSLILLALSVYWFMCPLLRPPLFFCWIVLGVEGQEKCPCYKGHQRIPPCFPGALVARTDLDITESRRRKMQIPLPLCEIIQHNRKWKDLKGERWFIRADVGIIPSTSPAVGFWCAQLCPLFHCLNHYSTGPLTSFSSQNLWLSLLLLIKHPPSDMHFKDTKIKQGSLKEAMHFCIGTCVWQSQSQK